MAKFGVKEVADVTLYDLVTNKPVLYLDTLKMTSIENTASSSSARGGKGNPKLLTWDFDRESTMQCQDALMSETSIALLTGNELVTGVKDIYKRQSKKVDASADGLINLEQDAVTGSVHVLLNGEPLTVTTDYTLDVATTGSHSVDVTAVAEGDVIEVFYRYKSDANAQTITISSDAFPSYFKVVGDTVVRNAVTGEDEPFQIVIHKAKLQPGFTLTFQADGDPTVFDMNLEVFRRDEDTSMIEMIKY
jgi:hypothetical protein